MHYGLVLTACVLVVMASSTCLAQGNPARRTTVTDWPRIVQDPYADVPTDGAKLTALPATADAWQARRREVMAAWRGILGPDPEPAPLDPVIGSEKTVEGIRFIEVSFATEGNDRCRAYLGIPPGRREGEKRPAVVVFHQTTSETINEPIGPRGNAFALDLTRLGYVTLSPECFIMKDKGPREEYGKTWGPQFQSEKLVARRPGWTAMGKMVFDSSRCVDYLVTRPEVDATRVAACGFSLGAKQVLYALAFEPRYAAGVFMEGGIGLTMSNWLAPHYLSGFPASRIGEREHHELLALVAPRPFVIIGGDDGTGKNTNAADGIPSWPFVRAALPVYRALDAGDRLGLHCNRLNRHDVDHYSKDLAYNWIDQWLSGGDRSRLFIPAVSYCETDQSKTPGRWTDTIITARLPGAMFDRTVEVPFTVEGPAEAGVDYTISPSPLVIPAGSRSAEIRLRILNQSLFESVNPKVVVKMGDPVNATASDAPVVKADCTWHRKPFLVER